MQAVTIEKLSKIYPGGKKAVENLSLSLQKGEVFGFLGPNGAGKTTTIKMLTGTLMPSGGACTVLGLNPASEPEKVHAVCGVVTEHAQMYDNLTGLQNLFFYGEAFGMPKDEYEKRARKLLEELELSEAAQRKLSAYSTGMRQRLSLARALMHRPGILFLDEPTSGLDPESAQNVNRMIQSLARDEGITVFLCTHQLRYAEGICSRFGFLEHGRLIADGTLEALRRQVFSGLTVCVRGTNISGGMSQPEKRDAVCGFTYRKTGPDQFEFSIGQEEEIPKLVRALVDGGGNIYQVAVKTKSLEEIYFALTEKGREVSA